jgi:thiol-disulfide isomerase/thioredoxin
VFARSIRSVLSIISIAFTVPFSEDKQMTESVNHPFFKSVNIEELNVENFEERMKAHENELVGVFFWGHDCPNCEIAKGRLAEESEAMNNSGLKWFHVNTYKNFDLGTKFGLFGIPTFLFFQRGKRLGRISPFPGVAPFFEAINKLKGSLVKDP